MRKTMGVLLLAVILSACGTIEDNNLKIDCVESNTNTHCEVTRFTGDTRKGN